MMHIEKILNKNIIFEPYIIFREGEPGVYVRLTMYYKWIAEVLAGSVEKKGEPLQVFVDFSFISMLI